MPSQSDQEETNGRWRRSADIPRWDSAELSAAGISVYHSKHLTLVTDLPEEQVAMLPPLADRLFENLELRLGKLPPARDASEFRITGYLIAARERFQSVGLMPEEEFVIRHGRHLNYEFWMFNPTTDYYRRHLLFHEFIHCFMTCEHGMRDIPPLWFTEGIAEYFATHRLSSAAPEQIQFGILPESHEGYEGWGRISEIHRSFLVEPADDIAASGITPFDDVLNPPSSVFIRDDQYAHAWAACWMMFNLPALSREAAGLRSVRSARDFQDWQTAASAQHRQTLQWWPLVLDGLTEGSDPAALVTPAGHAATPISGDTVSCRIEAPQGWQSTGVLLSRNRSVTIEATGEAVVNETTRPWHSEPDGITIRYHRGLPVGTLVGMVVSDDGRFASRRFRVGSRRTLSSPEAGHLWLQVNESAADRTNNQGGYQVTISAAQ
ncbi:MAG: hypothetical protein KDA96_10500 [Planctomycetaceae bacterium]|nr:hypothetical protein [Planctomycetaceae bacterium]